MVAGKATTKAAEKAPAKEPVKKAPAEKPTPAKEPKTATEAPAKKAAPKRQFVSPHPDGGWQVKVEGGKKATKRFDTKLEAEAYAKEIANNQGTSVMRQKKDGKLQKKH